MSKKIKNNIISKLKEALAFSDEIVDVIEKSNKDVEALIKTIIEKDKKDESTELDINNHRANITYTYLLNDDLRKVLLRLSTYYSIVMDNNIKLDLDEKDIKRLEFLMTHDGYNFVFSKGNVVAKDSELFINILNRVSSNEHFTHEDFLENLRNSEMYGKEGK